MSRELKVWTDGQLGSERARRLPAILRPNLATLAAGEDAPHSGLLPGHVLSSPAMPRHRNDDSSSQEPPQRFSDCAGHIVSLGGCPPLPPDVPLRRTRRPRCWRGARHLALAAMLASCSDYNLSSSDDKSASGEETGLIGGDDDDDHPGCTRINKDWEYLPALGWCRLYNDDGVSFTEEITGFRIESDAGSIFPDGLPLHLDGDENEWSGTDSWPASPHYESADLVAVQASDTSWSARTSGTADLGTIANCNSEGGCTWDWLVVEIYDTTRSTETMNTCNEYLNPGLFVCLEGHSPLQSYPAVHRYPETSPTARCSAGAGTFRLVPIRAFDHDDNRLQTKILRPVLVQGTGSLTADAVITRIAPLTEVAGRLSALRSDAPRALLDSRDRVQQASQVTLTVERPETLPVPGDVTGSTTFVLEGVPRSPASVLPVELAWTCPAHGPSPTSAQALPEGYVFSPDKLGCMGEWAQPFTVRPLTAAGKPALSIEVYGQPGLTERVVLVGEPGAERFDYRSRGLHISGVWGGRLTPSSAVVDLYDVSYRGLPICGPGRYTLPAEQ
ncbi:hypothetical protein LBMAG42_48250 [Deltaproteobacteria bacterium]|nr:hypothetical protein LBMAG42_48250 [Deltaproteobacteria bacterium]